MERIGEIIKRQDNTLQPNTSDSQEMCSQSEQSMGLDQLVLLLRQRGAPEWEIAIIAMAQDKRHDLPEITLESWRAKLSPYRDDEVCEALQLWTGEFFPSVDSIIETIGRKREHTALNRPWENYKAEQAQAASEGRLATDNDYEELRAKCRETMAKAPVIRASGRAHGKSGETNTAGDVQSGDTKPSEVPVSERSVAEINIPGRSASRDATGCLVATSQEDD